jgi:ribosomal protein S18 acetylase RimI-like enzyme
MEITLRIASGPEDADVLAALAREIWTEHYTPIIGAAQVEYMLAHLQSSEAMLADMAAGYIYTLAYTNGRPCGYSGIRFDKDALFLSKLYVLESCRGQGIARAMLNAAQDAAQQRGLKAIRLTCNKGNAGSLAAYDRFGFSRVKDIITDIGDGFVMDDYVMEKPL